MTTATPDQLRLYREAHAIKPVPKVIDGFEERVCEHDGIRLWRRGFYGWMHSQDEIRELARIERGGQ